MEAMTVCAHCGGRSAGRPLICPLCSEDPRVQGRYRLEGELGRGGGGVTWCARREPGGEPVCLKELRWATMGSLDEERRFAREGELLEALDHPAIPKHHGAFAWGEGRAHALFIAQELVVGDNLEVERRARGYALGEVLAMGVELGEVLAYLHERTPPIVHRDVKPSNVMRRVDGRLMLIDFGAARVTGLGASQVSVAGTFGFMAPEQIRGEAGPSSDVYGLGMTLAVLMAGGAPEALLGADNRPDFGRIVGVRRDLRALLEAMCAIDPVARPSAAEVARRCREMMRGPRPVEVRQEAAVAPPRGHSAPAARRGNPIGAMVALTALIIVGGAVFMTLNITSTVTETVDRAFEASARGMSSARAPAEAHVPAPVPRTAATPAPEAPVVVSDPLPLIAEGCALGQGGACEELARVLQRDRARVVALAGWPGPLSAGCEAGVGAACVAAAQVHAQGIGVEASRIETRRYFDKGCAAGVSEACASYGHMLLKGDGGPSDWRAALGPLEVACAAGDDDACLSVGAIHAEGRGAKIDRNKALGIFEGLCAKGMRAACDNVEAMVDNNWGLPASGAARIEALARLCDGRSAVSCERLADAYRRGAGVKKDPARAKELFTRSCDLGRRSACEKLR